MHQTDLDTADPPAADTVGPLVGRAAPTLAATIAGYALLAAFARPLTLPAACAVLAPGLVLLWWGARRVPHRTLPSGRATSVTWVGLGAAFCVWELVALFTGNDVNNPTFSILADPFLDTYPGRVAGYVLWLSTGAWLVTR
ncbi:hypothetical protein OG792_31865 [Micromonospora sp. NBC_01699]|uniref:hypothetical protein n=1 Tax=Micromonospora sp. NBC_01699 TaxID=2975984 RepID=UPI002E28837C|nr:hypothetical protein [Micromonospora sp. NBC_01699]